MNGPTTTSAMPLPTAGGCAAKMAPGRLAGLIRASGLAGDRRADVLVGLATGDDAAVVRVAPDLAIVQTVDVFPPVVPDPETFGAIAAANAMSDVWAMGGDVVSALAILTVPEELSTAVAAAILAGAGERVRSGGGAIVGGHTIYGPELTFGLSVTGTVHPDRVWTRGGARPGDVLLLTKPLGIALLTTGARAGGVGRDHFNAAIRAMRRLNRDASEAARGAAPHAVTDVTGFGLLGHLAGMIAGSPGAGATVRASALPLLDGALAAAAAGHHCGGLGRNRDWWSGDGGLPCPIRIDPSIDSSTEAVMWDPQTSGGLLLALPPDRADSYLRRMHADGRDAWMIGHVDDGPGIRVTP